MPQLRGALYLPKEWTSDEARCERAGVPKDAQVDLEEPARAGHGARGARSQRAVCMGGAMLATGKNQHF
jgi:hypothetical protein